MNFKTILKLFASAYGRTSLSFIGIIGTYLLRGKFDTETSIVFIALFGLIGILSLPDFIREISIATKKEKNIKKAVAKYFDVYLDDRNRGLFTYKILM